MLTYVQVKSRSFPALVDKHVKKEINPQHKDVCTVLVCCRHISCLEKDYLLAIKTIMQKLEPKFACGNLLLCPRETD